MSLAYRSYARLNSIQTKFSFNDESTFKSLKAHGTKQFMSVSPYLFVKEGIIRTTSSADAKFFFYNIWVIYVDIDRELTCHEIVWSFHRINMMKRKIELFVRCLCEVLPAQNSLSMNTHLLYHILEAVDNYGSLRSFWCFPFESQIR